MAMTLLFVVCNCGSNSNDDASQPAATDPDSGSNPSNPDTDGSVSDGPPAIQYIGRFDTRVPDAPICGWPGCRIIANFEGSEVSVSLTEMVEDWMIGTPSEWDYAIDGVWQPKLVMVVGQQTISLASNLGPGMHTVELYKRTEAQEGFTQFNGFDFGADGKLLPPPVRRTRAIEMIGDSMLTGFGDEGVGPDCPVSNQAAAWENFHISFGALLGDAFNADVYGTGYSGKGITQNIWRPDPWTMPLIYPLSNPIDEDAIFDFKDYSPDVLIIGIGGLDFAEGQPVDNGPATQEDFVAGYVAFLQTLRGHYPTAQFISIVGPGPDDGEPNPVRDSALLGISTAVEQQKASGDTRVQLFLPAETTPEETTGCEGHGNALLHQRMARELTPIVQAATGWQ